MARRQSPSRPTRPDVLPETVTITSSVRKGKPKTAESTPEVDTFMRLARKRYQTAFDWWNRIYLKMLEDRKFAASEQWDSRDAAARVADNKPVITCNYLPGIMQQVTNQGRQSQVAIKVSPVDSQGDKEVATVFQDLIRAIERNSDAASAYFTGFNDQVEIGLGFWRILRDYEHEDSFDKVLKIKRIRNPFSVLFDPMWQEVDFRDANYAFITTSMMKDDYRALYGDEAMMSLESWGAALGGDTGGWMNRDTVRVAEYMYVDRHEEEIVQVVMPPAQAGGPPRSFVIPKLVFEREQAAEAPGIGYAKIVNRRTVIRRTVKWAKIDGHRVLEGNDTKTAGRDWGGPFIPVIPCLGREIDINGEVDLRGMVRDAKGAARLINYAVSSIAEATGLAPKAPFLVEFDQIRGLEHIWKELNVRNFPYLPYKGKTLDGRLVPAPQRLSTEAQLNALVQTFSLAEKILQSTTALYEPNLGQAGNERSGEAIKARQMRGDLGTSHYQSNWQRAIKFTGEQLVYLIPGTYDAQRVVRIIGQDGSTRTVMVNKGGLPQGTDPARLMQERGVAGIYDLSVGRYDVAVDIGPSYPARRQESQSAMFEMVRQVPSLFPVIGDLIAEYSDWPGSDKIAARLKKLLDPKLQEGEQDSPEVMEAKIQQLTSQLENLSQQFEQAKDIINTEAQKLAAQVQMKEIDVASRERVAAMTAQVDIAKTMATLDAKKAETALKAELERITTLLEMANAEADRRLQRAQMEQQAEDRESQGDNS